MKFELYSQVALAVDLPNENLCNGDIATVVEYFEAKNAGEAGYALEVFDALGDTVAVIVVSESQIQPLTHNAVLSVRQLNKAA